MSAWLAVGLLATAVLLLVQPGRRPRAGVVESRTGDERPARDAGAGGRPGGVAVPGIPGGVAVPGRPGGVAVPGRPRSRDRPRHRPGGNRRGRPWAGTARTGAAGRPEEDRLPLGAALVEVAARLRTGMDLPRAWRATLAGQPGAPATLAELAGSLRAGPRADAVAGARAAVAVAERLGAPVADVLECCAQGLAEAEEGAGQRRTAMAAPRATARLLAWLPLAGLGLGVLLGVDPVAVFADGGAGTASLLLGLALVLVGRRWSAVLVRRAERAGS